MNPTLIILLPQGPVVSGVVTWAIRLANALAASGRGAGVIFHRPRPDHAPVRPALHPAVLRRDLDLPPLHAGGMDPATLVAAWERAMADVAGPIALAPNLHHDAYAAAIELARRHPDRIRLVAWCHNDYAYDYALIEHAMPALEFVVAPSATIARSLRERVDERAEDVYERPHGVPVPPSPPSRSPLDGRPIRLVYTGRMDEPQKRVSDLVRLARRLNERGIDFELRLLGDGPEAARVDARIADLPRVERLAACDPDAVVGHLDWADAFVLMSRYEAVCLSMYEAMARGCVPIVSRVSGVERVVRHDETGLLFEFGRIDDAAGAVESLSRDPALTRRLGAEAHRLVYDRHSIDAYALDVARLLDERWQRPPQRWPADRPARMPTTPSPEVARARLVELLHQLAGRRVAIWGAGRHTRELAPLWSRWKEIAVIIDEDPARTGETVEGRSIVALDQARAMRIDDVILSSAMHEAALWARRGEVAPARVHRLYASADAVGATPRQTPG